MLMLMPSCDASVQSPNPSVRWRIATYSPHVEANKWTDHSRNELQAAEFWVSVRDHFPTIQLQNELVNWEPVQKFIISRWKYNSGLFLEPLSV